MSLGGCPGQVLEPSLLMPEDWLSLEPRLGGWRPGTGPHAARGWAQEHSTGYLFVHRPHGRCLSSLDTVCFPASLPLYELKTLIKLALGCRMKGLVHAAPRAPHQERDQPGVPSAQPPPVAASPPAQGAGRTGRRCPQTPLLLTSGKAAGSFSSFSTTCSF